MSFLDSFLGGVHQREIWQDFLRRYDLGPPWPGITKEEAATHYGTLAANLDPALYQQIALDAFTRMVPEQRKPFLRFLRWEAREQGFELLNIDLDASEERGLRPEYLSELAGSMYAEQPFVYKQLFGPGMGGPTLNPEVEKAVLASLAAAAFRRMLATK